MLPLVIDTGRGKLSASDRSASSPTAAKCSRRLVREADVFVQGYRPGRGRRARLRRAGSRRPPARHRLCLVVRLRARRARGPYRRGFDSLVQTASGLNVAEAEAFGSAEAADPCRRKRSTMPLAIFWPSRVMAALKRRAEQGGSWHVRVSLAQTGYWLRRLGRIDGMRCHDPGFDDVRDRLEETPSGFGRLTAVRHAADMSETPPHWTRPSGPARHAPAAWPR